MVEKDANEIHYIEEFQDLLDAYIKYFDKAASSCYRLIKDKTPLIESFNDAAYPFNQAEDCDIVLCVSSNIVLELERSQYFDAIESCKGEKSRLQVTVSEVCSPSLIKKKFIIQPLNNQERRNYEKLKRNYSKIARQLIKE